jgi:nanoRNase/pAp phosphatase (c-di-AMP/oligoRNAs hydrolase)
MKYDSQLADFKAKLDQAKSVLVLLPSQVNNDKMAAALALYLSLKHSGKDVSIVSEAEIRVSQSVLFGVGDVKKELPAGISGNFIMSFEGVVVDGKVPSLVDLNYYPEGSTLNLVFNVVPGQKFEPINITHRYDDVNFDLLIMVGVSNLAHIGNVYSSNQEKFASTPKIDIDNSNNNPSYGDVNIIDHGVSISEMVMHILQGMAMALDQDIATNIITGIYDSTRGLTSNVTADTFLAIGEAMQIGGKIVRQTGGEKPAQGQGQGQGQPQAQSQAQGLDVRQQNQKKNDQRNDQRNPQRPDNRPNPQANQPKQSAPSTEVKQDLPSEEVQNVNPAKGNEQQQSQEPQVTPSMVEKKEELVNDILSNQKDEGPVGGILQPFKEDYSKPRESVSAEPVEAVTESAPPIQAVTINANTETPLSLSVDPAPEVVEPQSGLDEDLANIEAAESQKSEAQTPVEETVDETPVNVMTPTMADQANLTERSEVPSGEQVSSGSPETPAPDWLTPKIFKGGNLG